METIRASSPICGDHGFEMRAKMSNARLFQHMKTSLVQQNPKHLKSSIQSSCTGQNRDFLIICIGTQKYSSATIRFKQPSAPTKTPAATKTTMMKRRRLKRSKTKFLDLWRLFNNATVFISFNLFL